MELSAIQDKLTNSEQTFFKQLSLSLEEDLFFYGSILRSDYFPSQSDVDVDIFSDNETSTMYKLCTLLHLKKRDFEKVVYKINRTMVRGYKARYETEQLKVELLIYNRSQQSLVLENHRKGQHLSFIVLYLLLFVKWLYYTVGILPKSVYKRWKNTLLNPSNEMNFIAL